VGVDHYDELRNQNDLDAALVYGGPGCTAAQLWGKQGSHADHHRPAAVDQGRAIPQNLPEWVEAYVQDRAKSTEDIW
jgi:hypothetical protein